MIPFFCLITAHVLTQLTKIPGWHRFRTISMAGLAVIAIPNFLPPLMIRQYPRDVVTQVVQQYGPVNQSTTLDNGTTRQIDVSGTSDYVLLNSDTAFQYPVLRSITPPEGTIIFSLPHPLQYIPLQYEDWTPTERGILRSTDISMRLVKVAKMPIDVQFGSTYMLSAVTFPDGHLVKQCQLLHLYGWWRVVTVPSQDYYVRWALGGPKNIVPQISDSILQNGPGTTLKPGQEFLTHGYILIPCDFPVGEFQVSL